MSFEDDIKAEFEAPKPTHDVDVELNKTRYTLRFTQMDPLEWVSATDMFPPRMESPIDVYYGYNLRPLTIEVAQKTGKRVDGEKLVDLTPDQWKNLFKTVPGGAVAKIGDAIFGLNVMESEEAISIVKKAYEVASTRNST